MESPRASLRYPQYGLREHVELLMDDQWQRAEVRGIEWGTRQEAVPLLHLRWIHLGPGPGRVVVPADSQALRRPKC